MKLTTYGAERITAERARQIEAEGWTPEHDDEHTDGSLAMAAAVYAMAGGWPDKAERAVMDEFEALPHSLAKHWPWDRKWLKVTTRLRDLEKAGALIAAEIDRLKRAERQSN